VLGQTKVITGTVTDEQGQALAGANIKVKGTANGAVTDEAGKYSVTASKNATLIFSFSGFTPQTVQINNQPVIDVTLVREINNLQEVIVTGYRSQTRGSVLGSVTSVKGSAVVDVPVDNISNALSGRLSGVTITQGSGAPGMQSDIRIRASGTYNNADPLYVIDGIVSDKFAFDGLTADQIENITVLKDGASAAIYGSRAANGVLLVTTKRGKEGAPTISYTGMYGFQTPTKVPKTLNAFEHASAINLQLNYINADSNDARYYTQDELDYFKAHSRNWIDQMWQNPQSTQHSLDVSGGSRNVKYFLGGSYNYSTGSFNNLDYSKYTLRGNVDVSVTRDLKVSLDFNTDTRHTDEPSWQIGNQRQEDLYKALLVRTKMVPPYINGEPVGNWVEWHPGVVVTPSLSGYEKRNQKELNATVAINYTVPFVKGLSLRTSLNKYDRDIFIKQLNMPYNMVLFNTVGQHNHIVGDTAVGLRPRAADDFLRSEDDKVNRYQFNAQVDYKRNFGKHGIDALLVYEQAEEDITSFYGRKDDLISSAIDQYISAQTPKDVGGDEDQSARISYVGLASYNYDHKYLLDASFRYDASLIFPPGHRWGFFPSASAGWVVSDEPFFKNVHFINELKLRASVGLVGNDAVGQWQYLQLYNIVNTGAVFNNSTVGIEPGVLPNPDITWEKALSYNTGFDTRFWDNRMSFKLDLFYRRTYDILGSSQQSYPGTFGATLGSTNYQKIDAKGFEVELGYNGNDRKQFNYQVSANFGFATTKIIQVDEAENLPSYWSAIGRPVGLQSNGTSINKNGLYSSDMLLGYVAVGVIRTQAELDALPQGYTILGVKPQLGMLNYKDIRGPNSNKPDGKITSDDREFLGKYSIPPMNYGLTLNFAWKSFGLGILVQGIAGAKSMLGTVGRDIQARAEESSMEYWADSWSPENPNGKYPGYRVSSYRTRYDPSTFFLVDNSFVSLKNVNFSYALPQSMTKRAGLKTVRAFFNGTNLFMIYSANKLYDPEQVLINSYPTMKNYSFGLNISL
ncbi:MAG: SusC/RagA family TonB-linked outer membrane protein, partial [Ginsengibacter sp.]